MAHPAAAVLIIALFLLLSSSAHALVESAGNSEWQILTKRNFSSEIRLNPHILLMVTIPWSGEARSLTKQIGKLVGDQAEKYGYLRLMVVYKNFEKILANVLGATDDITFYYYHHSTSYKYNGRFAAEKILSSVNFFMSLKSEEVPLKPLRTKNELDILLESTDKTVFLIELCGWSSKLLHTKTSKNITSSAQLNYSENDDMFKASLSAEVDESLSFDLKKNQKGLINELSCGAENVLIHSHWPGEFCWANSTLEEMDYETADINLSCTVEEFEQFVTFFSKFKLLAREYFLPPERIRFGLISERALLPYVGVNTMGAWLVTLQFNGCPSCSLIIEAVDDLKKILQEHHSPIRQLDVDVHNLVPAFPANRPSVVLFIDRLSDSAVIREKSKSALNVYRKLAEHYQPSYRMDRGAHHDFSQSPTTKVVPESSSTVVSGSRGHHILKDSSPPKRVEVKDTMINNGPSILSHQTASDAQGNAVYNALLDFIKKGNHVGKKQTKVSLLAKEIGFQLLSDDFEVQVADSSPYYRKLDQLIDMNKVMSTGDQSYKLHQQPSVYSVNQNDDLLVVMEDLVVDDVQQAALKDAEDAVDVEDDIQKYLETATQGNSNTDEDDKGYVQNRKGVLLCHDENHCLQREVPSVRTCMERDNVIIVGRSSSSNGAAEKLSLIVSSDDFTGDDGAQVEESIMGKGDQTSKLYEQPSEDSVNQNEHKAMSIGDQTFKLHQQPIEDSVAQNDDLLSSVEKSIEDYAMQAVPEDAEDDVQRYPVTDFKENNNTNGDYKSCEKKDMVSLICDVENSLPEVEGPSLGTCMEKNMVDVVGCSSSSKGGVEEVLPDGRSDDFAGDDTAQVEENTMNKSSEEHNEHQHFHFSFFFIDGGYRLLNSLIGGSNIPSLVLLDPFEQHHYVFNEDRDIDFSSLVSFVEKFLKKSLSHYQPSASSVVSTKESPQPPFVNLDFHEIDAIPRLTTNTFCELVFGFEPCVTENAFPISSGQHLGAAWKKDVLVFFSSSWCGFCQRMELLVREVFHAFKYLNDMLKCESTVINPVCYQDSNGDMTEYSLPSIFMIDCAENDCGSFLESVGRKEYYPELLLFLAQNKSAIPYEGDMLVVSIIKFIISEGRNSQFLNKYRGYLSKQSSNNIKRKPPPPDSSPLLISEIKPRNIPLHHKGGRRIVPGSVLSATDMLLEAIPFVNSTILITVVDEGQVQGVIVNKAISWKVFDNLRGVEHLTRASLFYGGPVAAPGLPLVSLARKPTEGYAEVVPGFYYGTPVITGMVIEGIKSGDRSSRDFLFFLGYCGWKWEQIFDELAGGAWHLSAGSDQVLNWLNT